MGDRDPDPSFPTYADLTQTLGWRDAASAPVVGYEATALPDESDTRYAERALLGAGGMGKVMLAHDARVGRDVAVKQLHTDRELAPEDRARFLREARVQGQLEHPAIVPVYDIDQRPDGTTFFTMRRVLGRTLHQIIADLRAGEPLATNRYTQRELLTAFATICLTVDYAHSRGVIHRDLKPANVMLGDFGEVYVLDWGLARVVDEDRRPGGGRLSMTGDLLGTPMYMAPEQMADPSVGPAADVFSLGAMLFELLTLERLRDPASIYAPPDARPSVRAPARDIAPELETICVRATEADPADRYASPRALQEAIGRYLEGDRDREQRVRLASHHATRAHQALARAHAVPRTAMDPAQSDDTAANDAYERERGIALRELTRAIALDPANDDYIEALTSTLAMPPRVIPAAVRDELRLETNRIVKSGVTHSMYGLLAWFLFFPPVLAIGVRDPVGLGVLLFAAVCGVAFSAIAVRQRHVSGGIQFAILGTTLVAGMLISRFYGPLMLMPTLVVSYSISLQSHPWRRFRTIAFASGLTAMIVPTVLELTGVISPSYRFEGGTMIVVPHLIALPETGTLLYLLVANAALLVAPSLFIAQLRQSLSEVQLRQLIQKWQFRRLGDELVQRTTS